MTITITKKHLLFALKVLALLLVLIGFALAALDVAPSVADFVIAEIAFHRAGERAPMSTEGWERGEIIEQYGMLTNHPWLTNHARLIIPYFSYEGLTSQGYYPQAIGFAMYADYRSIHVLGTWEAFRSVVLLNERMLLDERVNDERDALSTLVHELVHAQGGKFTGAAYGNGPEDYESRTQAATIEVLAAMCNYQDSMACKSFWMEIHDMARADLMVRLHDRELDWFYHVLADLFWRNRSEEGRADKAFRFWADNQDEYWYIIRAYSLKPWDWVRLGLDGHRLDTGISTRNAEARYVLGLKFDDTQARLGWLKILVSITNRK